MFLKNIENIRTTFSSYYGTGKYFLLLMIALIYIFICEKEQNKKVFLVWYSCLVLLIILNPIFNKIVDHFLNVRVYNRLYWMVPIGIILAYAGVIFVKNNSKLSNKIFAFCVLTVLIIFSGNFVYTKNNYTKTDNLYKIPDEYVEVSNIIKEIPIYPKKAMVSTDLVPYIRLIAPSVRMAYPRKSTGYKDYPIVGFYEAGDVKVLTNLCKEKEVNIIVYDRNILLSISPTYFGYDYYTSTANYDIYVLKQ